MNLGFYYHVTLHSSQNGLAVPAYLGVFIEALASEVDTLILYLHEASANEVEKCDYTLNSANIRYYSLGHKTPAWDRFLRPRRTIRKIKHSVKECDILLVRAPSPLAPAFYTEFYRSTLVVLMIVGDYLEGVKYLHQPLLRKWAIQILSRRNDRQQRRSIRKTPSIVNSLDLYNKYKSLSDNIKLIRTTTIYQNDIFSRSDTCQEDEIKILYTGRIDIAKGLRELVLSAANLIHQGYNIKLYITGWEEDETKPIEKLLLQIAIKNGIEGKVLFSGRKSFGPDLFKVYRNSDIYVIPSYHEGFPRSIWEAMASGLPVITTRVGSIPAFIEDSAILIEPQNYLEISSAISLLIENPDIRRELIQKGYKKAGENTLEIRVREIAEILKAYGKQNQGAIL
jgi:glycosyltransferase involved in cell wall biosynthesis